MGAKPCRSIEGDAGTGLLILCDHAENTISEPYGTLGLKPQDLHRHIAYDLGAAAVAERLAEALGAPAILSRFLRLLIDPNRGLDDPTLIMQISDGLVVPGMSASGLRRSRPGSSIITGPTTRRSSVRSRRWSLSASRRSSSRCIASPKPGRACRAPGRSACCGTRTPGLRSLCSKLKGQSPASRSATTFPIPASLRATRYRHGTTRGLAHALVEIRQDLILAPEGQAEWGMRLAHVLRTVLSDASSALHAIELHGSLTDGVPGASAASGPARNGPPVMDERTKVELEAAAFRRLVGHLRARTDVQNIDLMELAGFCRNCLAAWYQEAAAAKGLSLSKEEAREIVYGLAYETWKAKHQTDASAKPRKRTG